MSRVIKFRAEADIAARLERLAQLTGRTRTSLVREALLMHLEDLEDACLADRVMGRMARGEETLRNLEDVERELGLTD